MTTQVDMRAQQLATIAATVENLRDQAEIAESVRDNLIREMRAEGYSAIKLAELTGVVRSRIYVILENLSPDADDYEYVEMSERIEDAWQYAVQRWMESDGTGEPEDFFPLEQLLARR